MPSEVVLSDRESIIALPTIVSNNPRERVDAEYVTLENIISSGKELRPSKKHTLNNNCAQIKPIFPLEVAFNPGILNFGIDDLVLVQKLRVWNATPRSIYVQYCGLWNEKCRLGASWCCYPRTRFLLAPGLSADFYIKATPKDFCPVQSACMTIQLAAAHMRDHVVGYVAVPIKVNFLKYIMIEEEGQE